jgi:hypothetical protein
MSASLIGRSGSHTDPLSRARSVSGAPVYGWFTEGFDTLDLKEAKASRSQASSRLPWL